MSDAFVPISFVADELLTSTKMNQLAADLSYFHDGTGLGDGIIITRHIANAAITGDKINFTTLPSCTAYLSSTQNTTNGVSLVNLDAIDHNQGSVFSTDTHLFTAPDDGNYLIAHGLYVATGSGRTTPVIYKNGSPFVEIGTFTGNFVSAPGVIILSLGANDTIGLGVRSDGAYSINHAWSASDVATYMSFARMA